MNQGPCEHMLALFKASEIHRTDAPASQPVSGEQKSQPRKAPSRWEVDAGGGSEVE